MAPPSIAMVNCPVGICEEDRHGQIEVKREGVQIDLIDVRDPDTDIVFGGLFKTFWRTDNLPVE